MPYPPHDGGAIAMFDVLNGLTKSGNEVTVFTINTPKHNQPKSVLDGKCKSVVSVNVDTKIKPLKAFLNLFKKTPYNFERFINNKVSEELIKLLQSEQFDIIQVEGAQVAYYIEIIKKHTKTPVILRAHNVESKIWERLSKQESNPFKKWYLGYLANGIDWYEKKYLNQFDKIIAITERDKQVFESKGIKKNVSVVPAGVDFDRLEGKTVNTKTQTLFVLGDLNWKPNEEGLKWFINTLWDKVLKACPDIELHIAGKNTPKWLEKGDFKNVKLHGFVESAEEFMKTYDLMLVPLLSGSGMRLKIIEGMALKKNILTTSLGAEGIEYADNKNIYIRDKQEDWLKLISAYYRGKIDSKEVGENAYQFAKEIHDNKIITANFVEQYKQLID